MSKAECRGLRQLAKQRVGTAASATASSPRQRVQELVLQTADWRLLGALPMNARWQAPGTASS